MVEEAWYDQGLSGQGVENGWLLTYSSSLRARLSAVVLSSARIRAVEAVVSALRKATATIPRIARAMSTSISVKPLELPLCA